MKRLKSCLAAALSLAIAFTLVLPSEVSAEESGVVTEIYGSANGWQNNGAWVGFSLGEEIDLTDEDADVKVRYEYIENGEIKTVKNTSGDVYEKNKFWDGYLVDVNNVRYSAVGGTDTTTLPADTIIQTNLSSGTINSLDVTTKIQNGDVNQVRTVVEVTDEEGAVTTEKTNWVTYTSDLSGSTPRGITFADVKSYVDQHSELRFDAMASIGDRQFISLQAAIDAAEDGDEIRLKDGIYYGPITIDKNISIIGESKEGTIIAGAEDTTSNIVTTTANVTLANLTIDGHKFDFSERHISGHGIYATAGLTVSNVDVKNIG